MKISLNINEQVDVTLTNDGIIHLRNTAEVYLEHNFKNGVLRIELWQLMALFGDVLYNGNLNPPFYKNEIRIVKD